MISTATARARLGGTAVALAPAVMIVALVSHPFIARLPDAAGVAEAVEQNTTRWGIVHLLIMVGSVLIALAFLAIRAHLRRAGEDRFSAWALPFVIAGGGLYGLLPALEIGPLAVAQTGGDVAGAQSELAPWFIPIMVTGGILFGIGMVGFARAIAASQILSRPLTRVVVISLVMLGVSRLIPLGATQFYLQAGAGVVALWPLAYQIWQAPQAAGVRSGQATTARPSPVVG